MSCIEEAGFEEARKQISEPDEVRNEFVDRLIRSTRDIIILSMLSRRPMSGYELIKEIFSSSNVFLSQGTVYPALYSFEEQNILEAKYETGDMRSKKYYITSMGREMYQEMVRDFGSALDYIDGMVFG